MIQIYRSTANKKLKQTTHWWTNYISESQSSMVTLWLQQNKSLNRAKLIFLKYIHCTLWKIWDVLQGIQ